MTIIWDKAWNIGHSEIDEQHQAWIDIFNRLEDAFLNGNHPNMKEIQRETLKEMLDYADYHFKAEEKFMNDNGYSEAAGHWRQHKDFKTILDEKLWNLKEEGTMLNSDLLLLMKNWLDRHILVEDRKFVMFLESQRS